MAFVLAAAGCGNLVPKINLPQATALSQAAATVQSEAVGTVEAVATKQVKATAEDSQPAQEATKAPKATQAPEATTAPSAGGGDSVSIDNLSNGLTTLKSYRMRYTMSFSGKDDNGKEQTGSLELMQEYIAASKNMHTKMNGTDSNITNTKSTGAFELFQIDNTSYIYTSDSTSDQKCISYSSADTSQSGMADFIKPADLLGGLHNAKLIKKGDNVNGVAADQYQAEQKDLAFGTFTAVSGNLWVAQDGGYVVKYAGEATGKAALIGKGTTGTFKWEYNIEDANKVESIQLPPECAAAKPADDIPVPPNATDKGNFGTIITFKSPDDAAKVIDFYKQELPGKGWKESDSSVESMLSYTKDARNLTIIISKEDSGGSSVMITEAKK